AGTAARSGGRWRPVAAAVGRFGAGPIGGRSPGDRGPRGHVLVSRQRAAARSAQPARLGRPHRTAAAADRAAVARGPSAIAGSVVAGLHRGADAADGAWRLPADHRKLLDRAALAATRPAAAPELLGGRS